MLHAQPGPGEHGGQIVYEGPAAGILRAVWMTPDEIRATASRHRSLLILQCIDDYLAGRLVDDSYPAEKVREAMQSLPVIA